MKHVVLRLERLDLVVHLALVFLALSAASIAPTPHLEIAQSSRGREERVVGRMEEWVDEGRAVEQNVGPDAHEVWLVGHVLFFSVEEKVTEST